MDIKLKVFGVNEVLAKLRYLSEKIPRTARNQMNRAADKMVAEAKLNAPERSGALVDSIRKEKTYGDKGRLQIDIVAGGTPLTDRYVAEVHENYEGMTAPSKYGSGPSARTYEKRRANPGRYIGEKFLDRAVNDYKGKLPKEIMEAIVSVIPKESL